MSPGARFHETQIGWMENHENMTAGEWHCPGCETEFFFIDGTDDTRPPKFRPNCGRRNSRA